MTQPAIQVEAISKLYKLTHQQRGGSFREAVSGVLSARLRPAPPGARVNDPETEEFWALRDVSFDVEPGQVIGIIGRNGAGKSTLLKILSRIVDPTEGKATLRGRVASLLEVGTGFHPELSGRENIYLNGSILGMRKREISARFDEIVAFSGVEKFLDTPVKRYSSGMYVRLAFAVAAHLEPEILIVDEVLAVGDAEFQRKCLGKMQEVSRGGGRTVVFVSHNMAAVRALCSTAVYMVGGRVAAQGQTGPIVSQYLRPAQTVQTGIVRSRFGLAALEASLTSADSGAPLASVAFDEPTALRVRLGADVPFAMTGVVIRIHDEDGTLVSSICSTEEGIDPFVLGSSQLLSFPISRMRLFPGRYSISVFVFRPNDSTAYLEAESFSHFEVVPSVLGQAMWPYQSHHGVVRLVDGAHLS